MLLISSKLLYRLKISASKILFSVKIGRVSILIPSMFIFWFSWGDEIILFVCLWTVTLIAIKENILNAEVCYNRLVVSSRQCINITHYSVWSVHNIKGISKNFLCPTLYHVNTSIIFDSIFYYRTIINPIKEASPYQFCPIAHRPAANFLVK